MSTTTGTKENHTTAVAKVTKDITKVVLDKIQAFQAEGSIEIPKNYSVANALKSAYIVLSETKDKSGKTALEVCTPASISKALLKLVTHGLSVGRGQAYFVVFGKSLELMVSYQGEIAISRRVGNVKEVNANCIMEGDVFEFSTDTNTGRKKIIKHEQNLESLGSEKILGAYAVVVFNDGTTDATIMPMSMIKMSWAQGSNSPAKTKFPAAMAERTVIRKSLKTIIKSSDDSYLDNEPTTDPTKAYVDNKVAEEANQNVIDIDAEEVVEVDQPEPAVEPDPASESDEPAAKLF